MHVSSAKENVKQYPQSLHPPTFRHALNLQKKFMYTVFEGKTGCDQLKGTCIKWPNIWSFDNDTWRRESPAWYPREAKRTTMKLYHTGQGFETCTSTCSVKVAQQTTLLLYESIYIVSFLFHEYETDIDFKVFYMNYFEILEKLFLLQTRYFRASNRVSIINWRIIMFKK